MKNLFFRKGETNWLGVVLVSALIGALTSWVILFISDSVLEISSPNFARLDGSNKTDSGMVSHEESGSLGICGSRVSGRQPEATEKQQCVTAGGDWLCSSECVAPEEASLESKCREGYCQCVCPQD